MHQEEGTVRYRVKVRAFPQRVLKLSPSAFDTEEGAPAEDRPSPVSPVSPVNGDGDNGAKPAEFQGLGGTVPGVPGVPGVPAEHETAHFSRVK